MAVIKSYPIALHLAHRLHFREFIMKQQLDLQTTRIVVTVIMCWFAQCLPCTGWAGTPCRSFLESENGASLSKKIRSQVRLFWTYMKQNATQTALLPFLRFEGIAAGRVYDIGMRTVESAGGSKTLRIWALVDTPEGRRTIIEFKQYSKTALSDFRKQLDTDEWLNEVREIFWPNVEPSSYDLVNVGNGGLFWIREKKIPLVDIPYSSTKQKNVQLVKDLAVFNANQLGLAHGRQSSALLYRQFIEQNRDAFHFALKSLTKDFIKSIKHPSDP
jgi:hypothetical protein